MPLAATPSRTSPAWTLRESRRWTARSGIEETDHPTIILSEADSAKAGVDLLLNIYKDYGAYFASGVFICDQNETWYIENCSGTQYVAIKVPDDMIFLEPNMAVIGRVDLDDKNIIASDKLIEMAQKGGTFVAMPTRTSLTSAPPTPAAWTGWISAWWTV